MTYQTDFRKKLGNLSPTPSPDWEIREGGSFFLGCTYIKTKLKTWTYSQFNIESVRELYFKAYHHSLIDWDCTVLKPKDLVGYPVLRVEILPFGSYEHSSDVLAVVGRFRLNSDDWIKERRASHFVVLNERNLSEVEYDPVRAGSQHKKKGDLLELYVFYSTKVS